MEKEMNDQHDSYTSWKLANPDTILLAEVSMNGDSVLFDYYDKGVKKFKSVGVDTLILILNLQDEKEQDRYHYVPKKRRISNE